MPTQGKEDTFGVRLDMIQCRSAIPCKLLWARGTLSRVEKLIKDPVTLLVIAVGNVLSSTIDVTLGSVWAEAGRG